MIVILDGEQLVGDFSGNQHLQALVDEVRHRQLGQRIIVSVIIDGESVVEPQLTVRLASPIGDVQQIDFESADPAALSVSALREVAGELGTARDELAEIGKLLAAGKSDDAIEGFCDFLGTWRNTQQAIGQCGRLLERDLTQEKVEERSIEEHLGDLSASLREMRDAFESRDLVLLSDLVEYEMPGLCERWSEMLGDLAERIGPGVDGAHHPVAAPRLGTGVTPTGG
jgi:hypothetical protein